MRKGSVILWLIALASLQPCYSRQPLAVCGTHRDKTREELHLHRMAQRTRPRIAVPAAAAAAQDIGQIAIIEDAGGVIARRNAFNLDQQTVTFLPATPDASQYHFQVSGASYDSAAAAAGSVLEGLGDDDTRSISLPFSFPFYGASWQRVYVNSDGNLTFGQADVSSTERSLGRVTAGPPRIAPLFRDLDPFRSSKGVRLLEESGRVVLSWVQVPEFSDSGVAPLQTFQVRLFPDGRIEFAWAGIATDDAVVGISPGGLKEPTVLVHFTDGSSSAFSATVAERFGSTQEVDMVTAVQTFFATHEDAYDYVVVFNALGIGAGPGALAYEMTVRNDRTGYGDGIGDAGQQFGSARRLQSVMNMGPLSQYPTDPTAPVGGRGLITGDNALTIIGHEAGHLFLAFVSVRDPDNPNAFPMLNSNLAHWSFNFDSEASLLEGNRIKDNGAAASPRFITTGAVEGYAPLDQYLMGFRAPADVPPVFLVTNSNQSGDRFPQVGVTISGGRRDVTVDDVIQVAGRRTPDYTVSQRHFRFAFVLIVPQGSTPTQADLDKLDTFRTLFETKYSDFADGRAFADTALRHALQLTVSPAAGVVVGRSITARILLQSPASTALTINLSAPAGAAQVPASVVVPAGASTVTFPITGVSPGVEELTAQPADAAYESAHARVQVAPNIAGLSLSLVSGLDQGAQPGVPLAAPVVVKVVDVNNLPYPGIPVSVTVTGGGAATPSPAVTNENGLAAIQYTPGSGPSFQLTMAVQGAPASAITVTFHAAPSFPAAGVVNAASFTTGLSPGGFASIFGIGLAAGVVQAATPPYPFRLGDVQVFLSGRPVPLHYVSDGQINFLTPLDTPVGAADLVVSNSIGMTPSVAVQILPASPGIFFDAATNYGAILISGTSLTPAQRPVKHGEYIEIYSTGLGAVKPSSIAGLEETVLIPSVFLGSLQLTPIVFSGLNPVYPGLYQVNVQIPAGAPSGEQSLHLEVGGRASNTVKLRVE